MVTIGHIVLSVINNTYGYKSSLEFLYNKKFSASLRYIVNCMVNYNNIKSPPSIEEMLQFFQTPKELYTEKLRHALFGGTKSKKELFNSIPNHFDRSKSCFF